MAPNFESLTVAAFQRAARRVPAYQSLLAEAGVDPASIRGLADFTRLPVLTKHNTFQRFPLDQLCVDGQLGRLGSVLTSSGHSGVFAFGLTPVETMPATTQWIDDQLDLLFHVRSRPTLLINCLPMGVKVPTRACTLAETSVRSDMVVGLVKAFAQHFAQIILVGEAAFIKHVLELGLRAGVVWRGRRIQVIVGEDPLAENARKYLEGLLGIEPGDSDPGMVVSSMGVAELGLNLFSEVLPGVSLAKLRRLLHEDAGLRSRLLGPADWTPSLFTYDPQRISVEFDDGRQLLVTTLDPQLRLPLVRYATGDRGRFLTLTPELQPFLEAADLPWRILKALPLVTIEGRGDHATAGTAAVYPEAIKEGLYHDPALAALTTANFRVISGAERARVRIQLSPGATSTPQLPERFRDAIALYARPPLDVVCETYERFGSGMTLDYERKFQYLEK